MTVVVVQLLSCVWLCDPTDCSTPGFPVFRHLLKTAQTHVHWVSEAIEPPHPLSSPSSPAFNFSQHSSLFSELALCIRWPKCWSFSFSISRSNKYSGLISFGIDGFDLFVLQGTHKSLLQPHSSKASFFGTQPLLLSSSHIRCQPYDSSYSAILHTDLRVSSISRHAFSPESSQSLVSWPYKPWKSSCWEQKWFSYSFTSSKWS